MIPIVIRTRCDNDDRLFILHRSLRSLGDKQLHTLGPVIVYDDGSAIHDKVEDLCNKLSRNAVPGLSYRYSKEDHPDTKRGLAVSLSIASSIIDAPCICCVDDVVYGVNIVNTIKRAIGDAARLGNNIGYLSLFACYNKSVRDEHKLNANSMWEYPLHIVYALVAGIYYPGMSKIYTKAYNDFVNGVIPDPKLCDDLWFTKLCKEHGYRIVNTALDYVQHIGIHKSTMPELMQNSTYQTEMFVGE